MAKDKSSFVLYSDWKEMFESLSDKQCAYLVRHIFRYVNDENPKMEDNKLSAVWSLIKPTLKRDLKKWEDNREKRIAAGKRGGIKSGESRRSEANEANASKSKQNEAVNGNVNGNVTVIENTGASSDLKNSNLFRKPIIPTKNEVLKAITDAGGTKEMAKSFYEKHEATGWFLNGSPIVSYKSLASRFVTNWNGNEKEKNNHTQTGPTLPILNKPK